MNPAIIAEKEDESMTKIDIISGFLGAGKTTFIKKMIEEVFQGQKIVLIENEFGEVGIDGGFLKDAGIEITEMNSGCICCSLVGDFDKNLKEVLDKFHPDRILIEPSGVGKLSDVMKSVTSLEKEQDVKLNALVTVVNAAKASKQMKAFGEFFNNQIEFATTVVLSRSQNVTQEKLELCVKQIQDLNQKAAVITTPWDDITGEAILNVIEQKHAMQKKQRSTPITTMGMKGMSITAKATAMRKMAVTMSMTAKAMHAAAIMKAMNTKGINMTGTGIMAKGTVMKENMSTKAMNMAAISTMVKATAMKESMNMAATGIMAKTANAAATAKATATMQTAAAITTKATTMQMKFL